MSRGLSTGRWPSANGPATRADPTFTEWQGRFPAYSWFNHRDAALRGGRMAQRPNLPGQANRLAQDLRSERLLGIVANALAGLHMRFHTQAVRTIRQRRERARRHV